MKKNPSDLSAVINYDGLNSMGIFRHFKLETIFYSKKWNEYRALDLHRIKSLLINPVIFDLRNIYNPNEVLIAGIKYFGIGR